MMLTGSSCAVPMLMLSRTSKLALLLGFWSSGFIKTFGLCNLPRMRKVPQEALSRGGEEIYGHLSHATEVSEQCLVLGTDGVS